MYLASSFPMFSYNSHMLSCQSFRTYPRDDSWSPPTHPIFPSTALSQHSRTTQLSWICSTSRYLFQIMFPCLSNWYLYLYQYLSQSKPSPIKYHQMQCKLNLTWWFYTSLSYMLCTVKVIDYDVYISRRVRCFICPSSALGPWVVSDNVVVKPRQHNIMFPSKFCSWPNPTHAAFSKRPQRGGRAQSFPQVCLQISLHGYRARTTRLNLIHIYIVGIQLSSTQSLLESLTY